jgi:DNA-directed RNA polymerase subunit RPC12/RpoP
MKDNSFAYKNETITFFNGYLDNINNYSIKDLFPNITISDTHLYICTLCVVQLESAYMFRELCQHSAAIIWRNKCSASQTLKFEHDADEVDNDSQNDISPALVDNVKNEQVSDENDEYLNYCGSTQETENYAENREEPTHSNYAKKIGIHLGVLYKCEECPKTFKNATTLKLHKKIIHLGVLYKCKECPKTFKHATGLSRHKQIIHLGVLYKCKECPKTFKNHNSLYQHKKKTHL